MSSSTLHLHWWILGYMYQRFNVKLIPLPEVATLGATHSTAPSRYVLPTIPLIPFVPQDSLRLILSSLFKLPPFAAYLKDTSGLYIDIHD